MQTSLISLIPIGKVCTLQARTYFMLIIASMYVDYLQPAFSLRACLHRGGGPQIGDVTCGGSPHLTWKRDQLKMRDYMERRVTPPKRVTSPTWVPPAPCKQVLKIRPVLISISAIANNDVTVRDSWSNFAKKNKTLLAV